MPWKKTSEVNLLTLERECKQFCQLCDRRANDNTWARDGDIRINIRTKIDGSFRGLSPWHYETKDNIVQNVRNGLVRNGYIRWIMTMGCCAQCGKSLMSGAGNFRLFCSKRCVRLFDII